MTSGLKKFVFFFVFCVILSSLHPKSSFALDLTQFIAGPSFIEHDLSTGEHVKFSSEGSCSEGFPVRQYKNINWEQFCISNRGVLRQEDTSGSFGPSCNSWAQDQKSNYTLVAADGGCPSYGQNQPVTNDGALWAIHDANEGQTWQSDPHKIVPIDVNRSTGEKLFCPVNSPYIGGCGIVNTSQFVKFWPKNTFIFCTGLKNTEDLIELKGIAGAGSGETFYYMKGWGLVGFIGGGFNVGLMGPGATQGNCSSFSSPPAPTGVVPEVNRLTRPCGSTLDNEKDLPPLRPYPFNPCDPFIPKKSQMTFQCANPVKTSGNFTYDNMTIDGMNGLPILDNPADPPQNANTYQIAGARDTARLYHCGNQICAIQHVPFDITIDLKNSQLPVIGNTQVTLDDATRVNNYLDWYLSGTVQYSERRDIIPSSAKDIDRLISFSGPIKKLIPNEIQTNIRHVIVAAGGDIHDYLVAGARGDMTHMRAATEAIFRNFPLASMEDVVGETLVHVITKQNFQPTEPGSPLLITDPYNRNAITVHIKHTTTPNDPVAYSDGRLYMSHIRESLFLATVLQLYANPKDFGDLKTNPAEALTDAEKEAIIKRITSTPDKNAHKGLHTEDIVQVRWGEGNGLYAHTPTRNTEIIDNPINIDAGVNLVVKNSATYTFVPPILYDGMAPAPDAPIELTRTTNASCGLSAVRIPGDNLTDKQSWSLKATLTYTTVYKYDPIPNPPNPNICGDGYPACPDKYTCDREIIAACGPEVCGPFPGAVCCTHAGEAATTGICNAPATFNAPTQGNVQVSTQTPFVEDIYDKLVSGGRSVLRRFLPHKTPALVATNTCSKEYIKGEYIGLSQLTPRFNPVDSCVRSVATTVTYTSNPSTPLSQHTSIPGGGTKTGTGELFFPYLGSIFDYFLGSGSESLNLQRMLRPKGVTGANTPVTNPVPAPASPTNADINSIAAKYNIPAHFIDAIWKIETDRNPGTTGSCSCAAEFAANRACGPMQMTQGAYNLVTTPAERSTLLACRLPDAFELAARLLLVKKYGTYINTGGIDASEYYVTGRYYGVNNCEVGDITRWGPNYGYCDAVHCLLYDPTGNSWPGPSRPPAITQCSRQNWTPPGILVEPTPDPNDLNPIISPPVFGPAGGNNNLPTPGTPGGNPSPAIPGSFLLANGTRNKYLWPLASNSPANMPIGSNAQFQGAGITNRGGTTFAQDQDIIVLNDTSGYPMRQLQRFQGFGWGDGTNRCAITGSLNQSIPVPDNWVMPDNGENNSASILLPDGRTIKQNQPLTRCNAGGAVTSGYLFNDLDIYGTAFGGPHGGSGLGGVGLTIKIGEFTAGRINHAMGVNLWAQQYYYNGCQPKWPATSVDGYCGGVYGGSNPNFTPGTLLALKSDFNVSSLQTTPGKIIAQAFKDYGAYVGDDTYWNAWAIWTQQNYTDSVTSEFQRLYGYSMRQDGGSNSAFMQDIRQIFSSLNMVVNNSSGSVGGGGTPLVPLAPPIGN